MKLHKQLPFYVFLVVLGCEKKNPQALIAQWNTDFQAKKSACESGDLYACKDACQMSTMPVICEEVRAVANMDDPEQRDWVAQCAPNAARQAASLCAAASALPAQSSTSSSTSDNRELSETQAAIDKLTRQQEAAAQQENALKEALGRAQATADEARQRAEAARNGQAASQSTKLEPMQVSGALSSEEIARVIGTHQKAIRTCYESRRDARQNLNGQLTVTLTISGTGQVQTADVRNSTLNDEPVERCVVSVFQRLTFPAPSDGGVVIVTFPLVFSNAD